MRRYPLPFAALVACALPITISAQPASSPATEMTAACDAVHAQLVTTPGITTRRRSGSITDAMLRAPITGCRIDIEGSFKKLGNSRPPTDRAAEYFEAQKWDELTEFSADGHDGTSFAYGRNGVACLVRGAWEGESDDEPDAPRSDPYTLTVLCGRAADFVPPK